jgi:hypothetical protein
MSDDNKQPEQRMMPDTMFVVAVAVVGCFFGFVLETWWVLAVGVFVMTSVYVGRKLFWHIRSTMRPDTIKRGILIVWIAVALLGSCLVGWAYWFYRHGGSYLAVPEIVGFVGVYVAYQGMANVRQITRKTPPR